MVAVWVRGDRPMLVGKAVLDPSVPTLFAELPDEVKFQAVNLRMEQVSGPSAPGLAGRAWRDADGETHGTVEAVEPDDSEPGMESYDAVISQRDTLQSQLTKTQGDLAAAIAAKDTLNASVQSLTAERDQAKSDLSGTENALDKTNTALTNAQVDLGTAQASVTSLTGERDQAKADLAAANATIATLQAQVQVAPAIGDTVPDPTKPKAK